MTPYAWARYGGYEVSTRGDARFSAFNTKMPDGRSIEEHYQCDVKGYDPGGRNWRLGKGKKPLRSVDPWTEYLALWRVWAAHNPALLADLRRRVEPQRLLSDRFASTPVNQAHALAVLLSEQLTPT